MGFIGTNKKGRETKRLNEKIKLLWENYKNEKRSKRIDVPKEKKKKKQETVINGTQRKRVTISNKRVKIKIIRPVTICKVKR